MSMYTGSRGSSGSTSFTNRTFFAPADGMSLFSLPVLSLLAGVGEHPVPPAFFV